MSKKQQESELSPKEQKRLLKKKRRKHIQIIKNLPEEIVCILEDGITNESVKRAIKLYKKESTGII